MRPIAALALLALAACKEDLAEVPLPISMTEEAVSHYCQMSVLDHGGPKAQIYVEGLDAPLFFAQVRDAMAFLKSPERDRRVRMSYVSDMGVAETWDTTGIDNWTPAPEAHFVIEAGVRGGMGAPEVVPFARREDAEAFATRYGGRIVTLDDIPDEAVLGAVDPEAELQEPSG